MGEGVAKNYLPKCTKCSTCEWESWYLMQNEIKGWVRGVYTHLISLLCCLQMFSINIFDPSPFIAIVPRPRMWGILYRTVIFLILSVILSVSGRFSCNLTFKIYIKMFTLSSLWKNVPKICILMFWPYSKVNIFSPKFSTGGHLIPFHL